MSSRSTTLSTVLFTALLTACQPVVMKTSSPKVIITNEVFKTDVIGDSDFTMAIDGVVFEAIPVDARTFDGNPKPLQAKAYDGGFNFVDVSITSEVAVSDSENRREHSTRGLLPKLLDAGISNELARSVLLQLSDDFTPSDRTIVATEDYHLESNLSADLFNPFTVDGRYLTLFKLTLSNTGNLMKEFCLPTLRLHTGTDVYEPFEKDDLMHGIPYGSVRFEVLNQLLVSPCTVLPPQTSVDRYLPFPSVIFNDNFRLTGQTGNQMNSVRYSVKRSSSFDRFVFNSARIYTKESGLIATSVPSSIPGVYTYSELQRSSFIFIETADRVLRVDNHEMLLQENLEPGFYNIIVVQQRGDIYTVTRVPLDPSTLVDGVILVELGD